MSADAAIMEALARIEHKADLALRVAVLTNAAITGTTVTLPPVGSPDHYCAVCRQIPEYLIDSANAVIIRKCACKTGKIAVDLKSLEPPKLSRRNNDVGPEDPGASVEDRPNPNSGRGHPGAGGKQSR